MRKLEVFFDYICPFCLKGHEYLTELLPQHPDIEVVWRPCEAHPRPETYGMRSDLCIQGFFHAQEQKADIWEYHNRMYTAALKDRADVENPEIVAGHMFGFLDTEKLLTVLRYGKYRKALNDANNYAYEQSGVWVVPAYRMEGKKLDSIEGVGITKAQLTEFLK